MASASGEAMESLDLCAEEGVAGGTLGPLGICGVYGVGVFYNVDMRVTSAPLHVSSSFNSSQSRLSAFKHS